jgi:hypothetical protein
MGWVAVVVFLLTSGFGATVTLLVLQNRRLRKENQRLIASHVTLMREFATVVYHNQALRAEQGHGVEPYGSQLN